MSGCGAEETDAALTEAGSFSFLTYNVAGLPQGISSSNPTANIPQISPRLNAYDVVVVQEDFAFHDALIAEADHPFQSEPKAYPYPLDTDPAELLTLANMGEAVMNDGLNQLSILPFGPLTRVQWETCYGVLFTGAGDCNAEKGFSVSELTLADGVVVRLYNLHAEAGSSPEDDIATIAGWQQIAEYIVEHEDGQPLIVAGDTNLHGDDDDDRAILDEFLETTGLTDACRALDCANKDRIDRVMVRSSDTITLEATTWLDDDQWRDDAGEPLSDHQPIHPTIEWSAR
jgi:hypothetical protein